MTANQKLLIEINLFMTSVSLHRQLTLIETKFKFNLLQRVLVFNLTRLSFDKQVNETVNTLNFRLKNISRIETKLSKDIKLTLVQSYSLGKTDLQQHRQSWHWLFFFLYCSTQMYIPLKLRSDQVSRRSELTHLLYWSSNKSKKMNRRDKVALYLITNLDHVFANISSQYSYRSFINKHLVFVFELDIDELIQKLSRFYLKCDDNLAWCVMMLLLNRGRRTAEESKSFEDAWTKWKGSKEGDI